MSFEASPAMGVNADEFTINAKATEILSSAHETMCVYTTRHHAGFNFEIEVEFQEKSVSLAEGVPPTLPQVLDLSLYLLTPCCNAQFNYKQNCEKCEKVYSFPEPITPVIYSFARWISAKMSYFETHEEILIYWASIYNILPLEAIAATTSLEENLIEALIPIVQQEKSLKQSSAVQAGLPLQEENLS